MKVKHITAATLCAHASLAVPHGVNHRHLHDQIHKRDSVTVHSIVTNVVTVTNYNAVVWVDVAGNIVKTEYNTPATSTVPFSSTFVETIPTSTTSKSLVAPPVSSSSSSIKIASATSAASASVHEQSKLASSIDLSSTSSIIPVVSSSSSPKEVGKSPAAANPGSAIPGFGVAYDAWAGTACRSTLDSDFAFLASQGATAVRVYDVCFLEAVNSAATHNLRLMIGLTNYIDFDTHLQTLISEVKSAPTSWSVVDTVFIGNELVNNKVASPSDVAAKVSYAKGLLRAQGFTGNVVTVDTWTAMRDDPTICSASDFCAVNAHAFFDGQTLPQNAGTFVRMAQNSVAKSNPGKRVVVTETGWPHGGAAFGVAIPGVENQRVAMASVVEEFAGDAADVFLFMAYDATYKTGDEVERNFGIFDVDVYNGAV